MTQHTSNVNRQHQNGFHNRWCHQLRPDGVFCKFTGKRLSLTRKVGASS